MQLLDENHCDESRDNADRNGGSDRIHIVEHIDRIHQTYDPQHCEREVNSRHADCLDIDIRQDENKGTGQLPDKFDQRVRIVRIICQSQDEAQAGCSHDTHQMLVQK